MLRIHSSIAVLLVLASLGCRTYTPPERMTVPFDDREWALANSLATQGATLDEYLLASESQASWTESLGATFNSYELGASLDGLSAQLRRQVAAQCPGIQWETIRRTDQELVYRWAITGCGMHPDQHEIGRMVATEHGIHRVAYVVKRTALSDQEIESWVNRLDGARVVPVTP